MKLFPDGLIAENSWELLHMYKKGIKNESTFWDATKHISR